MALNNNKEREEYLRDKENWLPISVDNLEYGFKIERLKGYPLVRVLWELDIRYCDSRAILGTYEVKENGKLNSVYDLTVNQAVKVMLNYDRNIQ